MQAEKEIPQQSGKVQVGRPPIWSDPIAFEEKVNEYFETESNPTWTGLAYFLGFESRQSLQDYKEKPGFSYPIKRALLRIEQVYEENLFNKNAAGPIFALKNFNWQDKQEIKHEGIPDPTFNVRISKDE